MKSTYRGKIILAAMGAGLLLLAGGKIAFERGNTPSEAVSGNPGEPGGSAEEPGGSAEEPGGSAEEPGGSTEEPGGNTKEPGRSTEEPGGSTEKPDGSTEEPGESTGEQGGSAEEPGGNTEKPDGSAAEPWPEDDLEAGPTIEVSLPESFTYTLEYNKGSESCSGTLFYKGTRCGWVSWAEKGEKGWIRQTEQLLGEPGRKDSECRVLDTREKDSVICHVIECRTPRFNEEAVKELQYLGYTLTEEEAWQTALFVVYGRKESGYGLTFTVWKDWCGEAAAEALDFGIAEQKFAVTEEKPEEPERLISLPEDYTYTLTYKEVSNGYSDGLYSGDLYYKGEKCGWADWANHGYEDWLTRINPDTKLLQLIMDLSGADRSCTILDTQETDWGICYVIECSQSRFAMAEQEQLEIIGIRLTPEQNRKRYYYVVCGRYGEKEGWMFQIEGDVIGEEAVAEIIEACSFGRE